MYSGYGGSPSRTISTMSLSVRPVRRLASKSITRSQSFTGVNTYNKPYRNLSVFNTPGLSRKPSRASKMFTMSTKPSSPPKAPQPERLDQVYEALKKGLKSYLQVKQMDLDNLSRQMKESKRNSRLGFLYELDKQLKVTERYIRRLEFHLSKIEEHYEAYCLQRRLRDGADKMVKAFIASSGSKEAKESLAEANKGYREYTEKMCALETELENQLGEFHIKMKGLAGFARLCAGDQYEIFMKYGRQRWKLRGKIEINAKQVWDSEEIVFLPLINDFLFVKVTELKSLANHVVVGNVSCETKDLFAALPQTVAVDINDLGTIKLSLEVTWNPFEKDDQGSVASTVNKVPTVSKRLSTIFNQSPPDTPSLREQAFYSLPRSLTKRQHWLLLDIFRDTISQSCSCSDYSPTRKSTANMLRRHEVFENGAAWSNSSESSDDSSSPQLPGGLRNSTHLKAEVVPSIRGSSSTQHEILFCSKDSSSSSPNSINTVSTVSEVKILIHQAQSNRKEENKMVSVTTIPNSEKEDVEKQYPSVTVNGLVTKNHSSSSYLHSPSHISESIADGILIMDRSVGELGEQSSLATGISVNDIKMEIPNRTPNPAQLGDSETDVLLRRICGKNTNSFLTGKNTNGNQSTQIRDRKPIKMHQDTSIHGLTSYSLSSEGIFSSSPSKINTHPELEDVTYVAQRVPVEEDMSSPDHLFKEDDGPADNTLEDALGVVLSSLDDYRGQFPELQLLEQELKLLQVSLKEGKHSRSPSVVSLTVETVLGSFDFLNMSDWEEEQEEQEKGSERIRSGRFLGNQNWERLSPPTSPLTTGCTTLDCALVVHLRSCSAQLLRLGIFGPLRCGEMYALDRLLRESRVIELIRCIFNDNPRCFRQLNEVIPRLGLCPDVVSLWQQCVGQGSVYSVSAENFLETLCTIYSSILPERACSLAGKVFLSLVERVLGSRLPKRGSSREKVMVTLFQLWIYIEANGISDMETHITELTEEVWLVQRVASGKQDVIIQTLRHPAECSLRRDGLHAVIKLLKDPRGKVSASASSLLRSLAAQPRQRERALVSCLELLEDENVETRVCGCKALVCLKAKESIGQLVYLCQTDKEEVRNCAKQALLMLGDEGKIAHRHVEMSRDSIPRIFAPGSMASTAF